MLKTFFEIGCDASLFDGMKISQEKELCERHMGKYPVISITLKNVSGLIFEAACRQMKMVIGTEAERFAFLEESSRLSDNDRRKYRALIHLERGVYMMPDTVLENSLQTLCVLLEKHYGQKVILLIDEYDVPLDKAFQRGFYNEMVSLIRSLFGSALKTNDSLYFAVLTGCLRKNTCLPSPTMRSGICLSARSRYGSRRPPARIRESWSGSVRHSCAGTRSVSSGN